MDEKDLIYARNVADKYDTYLYPELRYHVETYLTQNIDKAIYYANYKLNINVLIQAIIKDKDLLNGIKPITTSIIIGIIAPLVEKEIFIRGL